MYISSIQRPNATNFLISVSPEFAQTQPRHTNVRILGVQRIGAFRTRVTLEIDEPHSCAQGLLSNIYPIKMKDSIEFVWAMHTVEVDLRPYTTSKRRGEYKVAFNRELL